MTQLSLDDAPAPGPARNDYEEGYRRWLETHEKVFRLFEVYALEMMQRKRRFGIAALLERVRWEVRMTWEKDEDGYKINNNHKPYIARDLIAKHPGLDELIETRSIRSDEEKECKGGL